MSKRPVLLACALALTAAACSEPPVGEIAYGEGTQFVPQVADSIDDVGLGSAIAVNADGVPFVSYWGFPAVLEEGDIAIGRPIGAPFVPGVLIASQADGVWNRGAAAMYQDAPDRVAVPFGPATVESLADASPTNTNGTDIAVDANGGLHVVWAAQDGVWYGGGGGDTGFSVEQVFPKVPLSQAGPIGWPSVAVDADGTPWIAVTVAGSAGPQVLVATPKGDGWDVGTVAEPRPCSGCFQGLRTDIAVTPDGPLVVYADGAANAVMAARRDDRTAVPIARSTWTSETVGSGAEGVGISVAIGGDGTAYAAYYGSPGSLSLASSFDGDPWSAAEVAEVGTQQEGGAITGESTGVAVTDDGTVYLTWYDPGAREVELASSADGVALEPIETRATDGGRWPAIGVTADGGTVFLSWYDTVEQNLGYGTYGETGDLVVAAPSPSLVLSSSAPAGEECSADTTEPSTDITVVAPPGAATTGFEQTCVVAPAGEKLSLTFENQDPGGLHNAAFYTTAAADDELFTSGLPGTGPETQTEPDVPPQDEGSYFFRCDVHPSVMTGTFVVATASKK